MTDVSVLVSVPDLAKQARIDIPPITLTDIGGASNGVPGAEIARQILEPVINQALRTAAAQSLQDEVEQQLDNARNQLLEGLREQLGDGNETDP